MPKLVSVVWLLAVGFENQRITKLVDIYVCVYILKTNTLILSLSLSLSLLTNLLFSPSIFCHSHWLWVISSPVLIVLQANCHCHYHQQMPTKPNKTKHVKLPPCKSTALPWCNLVGGRGGWCWETTRSNVLLNLPLKPTTPHHKQPSLGYWSSY